MNSGGLGAAVRDCQPDEHVVRTGLRVLDGDIEVTAVREDAGVRELELGIVRAAATVLFHELRVGKLGLGVLVERLQVRVRRRGVEVVVAFLHVLAVVALGAGEAEEPFLEDRILPVPQRDREAETALAVGYAEQPVLPPAIRAAACVVVREVVPGGAVLGIILAHGAPLPLGQVRTPALPVACAGVVLGEPL